LKDKIPLNENLREAALLLGKDPYDFFLGESDDYELVITCNSRDVEPLRSLIGKQGSVPVAEVGRITGTPREITLLTQGGERRSLKPLSWDHFRPAD